MSNGLNYIAHRRDSKLKVLTCRRCSSVGRLACSLATCCWYWARGGRSEALWRQLSLAAGASDTYCCCCCCCTAGMRCAAPPVYITTLDGGLTSGDNGRGKGWGNGGVACQPGRYQARQRRRVIRHQCRRSVINSPPAFPSPCILCCRTISIKQLHWYSYADSGIYYRA